MGYGKEYYGVSHAYHHGYDALQPIKHKHAEKLFRMFQPKTAIEVGCAKGFMVEKLRQLGVNAQGFDISEFAINGSPVKRFLKVGRAKDWPIKEQVELIYSFDVMEHLPLCSIDPCLKQCQESCLEYNIHWISTALEKDIGDASGYEGIDPTHISMFTPEWWLTKFKRYLPQNWFLSLFVNSEHLVFNGEKFNSCVFMITKANPNDLID